MGSFRLLLIAFLSFVPIIGEAGISASTAYALETGDRCTELREEIARLKRQIREKEREIDKLEDLRDQYRGQCQREVDEYHDCLNRWSGNEPPSCSGSLPSCRKLYEADRQLQEARRELQALKDRLDDAEEEADDLDCPGNRDIEDILLGGERELGGLIDF